MRIAIFSDNFYPELSGISDSVRALAKTLAGRGHIIKFYAPYYSEKDYAAINVPFRELDLGPHVSVRRLWSIPFRMGTDQGRAVIPFGLNVRDVAVFAPDVIHTQMYFGVGLEATFASWALKRPLVGTQHTAVKEFLRYSPIAANWFKVWFLSYVNWYYEHCDLVTAPSQCVFEEMRSMGFVQSHVGVVSNPVDVHVFRPLPGRDALKKKFGFTNATIIHAGRLSAERHPEVLVKALPIIKKTVPEAMLAFAGNGTMEHDLRALVRDLQVEDSVKFLGFIDHPTLCEAYNAAEIFGITSTDDTQSLVMMQAMASGLPVIGVNARGLPEYINAGNGYVVEPNDEHAVAEKAVYLLKNPAAAKKLGRGARAYAETFSDDAIASVWEKIYGETVEAYNKEKRPR